MRNRRFLAGLALVCVTSCALADTLKLKSGGALTGVVIQEDAETVTLAFEYGTTTLYRSDIVSIEREALPASSGSRKGTAPGGSSAASTRLPGWSATITKLSQHKWATKLHQIPATVIDVGVMRNVPYMSYRCATNYEINVYGDPDSPAGVEIGILGDLLRQPEAKRRCLEFITSVLSNESDRKIIGALDLSQDVITRNGLTFEITPETAEDAYGGWWVSVYDEGSLDKARASDKEVQDISVARTEEKKSAPTKPSPQPKASGSGGSSSSANSATPAPGWSDSDMKSARATRSTAKATPSSGRVYVRGYYRKNGTYVSGHSRRR